MDSRTRAFLSRLLDAHGPSGFETPVASAWQEEAGAFADETWRDVHGNAFAAINPGADPRAMLAGHIDEIGLMVHHIDDDGFLYVKGVGGWDPQVLVGQRVEILAREGVVPGVIGRRAIHLIPREDVEKAVKLKELWIDIGAKKGDEAREHVAVGDVAVVRSDTFELANGRLAARSIDDRVGAVVALEALRRAKEKGCRAHVVAVATTQEEVGYMAGGGARTSAYALDPRVGIVIDVTHATDHPTVDQKEHGEVKLGGGPVLSRGAAVNPVVLRRLVETAQEAGIAFQWQASPSTTGTDADAIRMARAGVATGLVSIPDRYMHSPNQIIAAEDVEAAAELIGGFLAALGPDDSFVPE